MSTPIVVLTREQFEKVRAVVALSITAYALSKSDNLKEQSQAALHVLEKAHAASESSHSRTTNGYPGP